ncbi:AbrB family transcriptional regulator [Salinisphaera sp. SWV1]|uniref:AbrB family transcriptional regulator n=1 Tax=Salinisphaera sp. SWV1 TaxID=3454139 RepID=UPI003F867ED6
MPPTRVGAMRRRGLFVSGAIQRMRHGPAPGRWILLIGVSLVLGVALRWCGLPAGFLLGPMIAAIALSVAGGAVAVPRVPFQLSQAVIGCLIARTITLPILTEIGAQWPVFLGGVFSVIAVSLIIGWLLTKWQVLPGPTAIWGVSPGAAVAMTLMSSAYGADARLVAFMQYTRVVIVASAASILAAVLAPSADGGGAGSWWPSSVAGRGGTLLVVAVGFVVARLLRTPAGPLLAAIVIAALAQDLLGLKLELPLPLLAVSFAFVGWGIGMRFTRSTLSHAVRALPAVIASILILVLVCGGIAVLLVVFAGVAPLTAYLATSPGGADTVAIIASSTHVDVAYIMAMQLARFFAVMLTGPFLARMLTRWSGYHAADRA